MPTKFHIRFGEPLSFTGAFDDEDEAIEEKVAVVKGAVDRLIAEGRKARAGWFR
jgi:hypothetical protein